MALTSPLRSIIHSPVIRSIPTPWTIGDWKTGANTSLTITSTRARATIDSGSNPRISRHVISLTPGATYRVKTTVYIGTAATGVIWRVSATQNLDAGDYFNSATSTADTPIDATFVAPAGGEVYAGVVGVAGTGQYVETDEQFILTRE